MPGSLLNSYRAFTRSSHPSGPPKSKSAQAKLSSKMSSGIKAQAKVAAKVSFDQRRAGYSGRISGCVRGPADARARPNDHLLDIFPRAFHRGDRIRKENRWHITVRRAILRKEGVA